MSWPIDTNPRHWLCSVIGIVAITGIVAISGCEQPAASSATDMYAGVWSGTIGDESAGNGTFSMTLRVDSVLAGTWFASVAGQNPSGTLTADSLTGATRSFALSCTSGAGQGSLLLVTTVSGQSMTGTYRSFQCPGVVAGTVSLTRR
jgi:hypothetical protein